MKYLISFELFEDVAERRFNIEPEFFKFDKEYNMMQNKSKQIYRDDNYKDGSLVIIKNPLTLSNIGPWARGIIDKNGDLYIEQESITIHDRILKILINLDIIHTYTDWMTWVKNHCSDEFLTVQRSSNTNTIKIGETETFRDSDKINPKIFLDKAKLKNIKINFDDSIISNTPRLKDMGRGKKYAF